MKKILIICALVSMCSTPSILYAEETVQNSINDTTQSTTTSSQKVLSKSDKEKYDKLCDKADALIKKKKHNEADILIQKALAINPDLDMAHALKSIIYLKQKDYDKAKLEAQKALNINSENDIANCSMGIILHNVEKKYADVLNYYHKALKAKPNNVCYITDVAIIYGYMRDYVNAIEYYTKSLQYASESDLKKYDIYAQRANLYFITKQYDLALQDADSAIKLDSKNYLAYSIKAKVLANRNEFHNAMKCADKAVNLSKKDKNSKMYIDRIYVYRKLGMGNSYTVTQDIKLAEEYAGNDTFLLGLLAEELRYNNKLEAIRIYKKIMELDPKNYAVMNYAYVLIEVKDYLQALSVLENFQKNYQELIDTNEDAKRVYHANIATAKLGIAKLDNKKLISEAIEDLKLVNTDESKSYFIANGYLILGDYKNAYDYYKKVVKFKGGYDFSIVYKILILKQLASYDNYNPKTRVWGVPDWIFNDNELPDFNWDNAKDSIKDDVIARVNFSNGATPIQDKNYILSTIQTLRLKKYAVGKVYNLHINDDAYGNTSRIVVYPYIDALDNEAKQGYLKNEDHDLILANQYFLLIHNSLMHLPKYYSINEVDVSNFFSAIEKIPSDTAKNYIADITDFSLVEWDIFDNKDVSLSFYHNMISYLKSKGLDKNSNKVKERIKTAYLGMGDYYREKKGMEEALYYYNSAIPYGASAFEINEYIGNYYFDNDNYFKAIDYFSKVLAKNNNAEIYLKRGYSKAKLKDYDGAIYDYNKAIGYNKNLKLAYWERAQVLFEQKKYSAALNDYIKYSSFDKKDASAQYNAGICLYNMGKKQQAIPYLEKAKSLAQASGNTQLYNSSVRIINEIKGYNRRYY